MARPRRRSQKMQPPAVVRVRVPRDADIPEDLQGLSLEGAEFALPVTVPESQRFDYIMSNARQEKLKQEAAAAAARAIEEEKAREQALLEARVAEAREAAGTAPVPVEEPTESTPEPSGNEALQLAASLNNVMASLLTQSKEVQAQQAQVADLVAQVEQLQAQVAQAGIEKEEALKLVKNAQMMMNGLVEDTSLQIRAMQSAVAEANTEAETYRQAMDANKETVEQAADITEASKVIAKEAAEEQVEGMYEQMLASANAVLSAAGVSRGQFLQRLNAGLVQGDQAVIATANELKTYAQMLQRVSDQEAQTEEEILTGASEMARQRRAAQQADPNFGDVRRGANA